MTGLTLALVMSCRALIPPEHFVNWALRQLSASSIERAEVRSGWRGSTMMLSTPCRDRLRWSRPAGPSPAVDSSGRPKPLQPRPARSLASP